MAEIIQWEIPEGGYERVEKLEEIAEEIQKMINDSHWDNHIDSTEDLEVEDGGWFSSYDPDDNM